MKLKLDVNEKTGLYLGTEINGKWWKRYKRDRLFARGNGRYWHDDRSFYFLRYLTKEPIGIPFEKVKEFKTGTWHSGRWCFGYPVLKILWTKDDLELCSGFLVSKSSDDVERLISEWKAILGSA